MARTSLSIDRKWAQSTITRVRDLLVKAARRREPIILAADQDAWRLFEQAEKMEADGFPQPITRAQFYQTKALLDFLRHGGVQGRPPRHPTLNLLAIVITANLWADSRGIVGEGNLGKLAGRLVTGQIVRRWWTVPRERREDVWLFGRRSEGGGQPGQPWVGARRRLGVTLNTTFARPIRAWLIDEMIRSTTCGCDRSCCWRCQKLRRELRDYMRSVGRPILDAQPRVHRRSPR